VPVFGITGGIATGKSSFVRALLKHAPAELFDADRCVHQLLAEDPAVHSALRNAFGPTVFGEDGTLNRAALRERVFEDEAARLRLEAILHPPVREQWIAQADTCRRSGTRLYADIPLLYETGGEAHVDRVIVVACSPATQRERLRLQRGLANGLIERMISAQLDLATKIARADHVVWNDSTPAALDDQARLFAAWLCQRYG
jgi:dephospho-CoA kinase